MQTVLIAAVTVETLVCSMFFLSVIVSRLRFYGVLERVDFAVRAAKTYNEKEEMVYHLKIEYEGMKESHENPLVKERLTNLHQKVKIAVDTAEPLVSSLSSVSNYMWAFRSLGIGSFLLILFTSAFLISIWVALALIGLSVLAYSYTSLDQWRVTKIVRTLALMVAGTPEERLQSGADVNRQSAMKQS
jgi:hypothetical protein